MFRTTKMVLLSAMLAATLSTTAGAQAPVAPPQPAGEREIVSPEPERDPPSDTQGTAPWARIVASWAPVAVNSPAPYRTPANALLQARRGVRGRPRTKSLRFPRPGQDVLFSAATTTDGDGTIAGYAWTFERAGQTITRNEPTVQLSSIGFTRAIDPNAPITATLKVTDSDGLTSTTRIVVPFMANLPPTVDMQRFKKDIAAKTVLGANGMASPDITNPVPAKKNVDFAKVVSAMPLRVGVWSRLHANAADPDGEVVAYAYDLVQDDDAFADIGRTDEVTVTPDREGEFTYRVRVTDDEGATAESTLTLNARIACAPNQEALPLGKHVHVTPGSACLTKTGPKADSKSGDHFWEVLKPEGVGEIVVNGLTMTVPVGSKIGKSAKRDDVCIKTPTSLVSGVSAQGVRLVWPAQKIEWCIDSDGVAHNVATDGTTLGGLKVSGWKTAPTFADRKPFTVDAFMEAPAQFEGVTGESAATFLAYVPSATATKSGVKAHAAAAADAFTIGPMDLPIAGMNVKDAKLVFDGDDSWVIDGNVEMNSPLPLGHTVAVHVEIVNGAFSLLTVDDQFKSSPIAVGTTGVSITGIRFELQFGAAHENACVPNVGKKRLSFESNRKLLQAYGWSKASTEKAIPDVIADYGIPAFALCGTVSFTYGSSPIIKDAALITGDVNLGIATYSDGRPGVFRISASSLRLLGLVNASAHAEIYSSGYINFDATATMTLEDFLRVSARVYFEAQLPRFNAGAWAEVTIIPVGLSASAEVLLSSRGAGACARVHFAGTWTPGATVEWGKLPTPYLDGCDVGEVKEVVNGKTGTTYELVYVGAGASQNPTASAAQDSRSPRAPRTTVGPGKTLTFPVKARLPGVVIAATSAEPGRLPRFRLTAPGGAVLEVDDQPAVNDRLLNADDPKPKILKAQAAGATSVVIAGPKSGNWTLQNTSDSLVIKTIRVAEGSPHPQAQFSMRTLSGGRRGLAVRIADRRRGMTATVVEHGATGGQVLLRQKLTPGITRITKAFQPRASQAEPRQLAVYLDHYGLPAARIPMPGGFTSSAPPRPASPEPLKLVRGSGGVKLRWDGAKGLQSFKVKIQLSDGRMLLRTVRATSLSVRLQIPRWVDVRAAVQAVSVLGATGRPAFATSRGQGVRPGRLSAGQRKAFSRLG